MAGATEAKKPERAGDPRVHMANERTFLAWIRTSVAIMAFGFVVEKFALFMKQMEYFLGRTVHGGTGAAQPRMVPTDSSVFGIILVALGALMGVLAFVRYKRVEKQIDRDNYRASLILDILLTIAVAAVGVFLVVYLSHSL
jgi:putative membrane protein